MNPYRIHADPRAARHALRNVCRILRIRVRQAQAEPDAGFARAFPALVDAVEAGLRREEAILEAFGDRVVRERRAENAIILSALHRVTGRVEEGCVGLGRQVAAALCDVLAQHRIACAAACRPPLRARRATRRS